MRIFVTGTDTGVGKTLVSCALIRAARAAHLRTCGVKPIETGCVIDKAGLQPTDAITLAAASAVDGLVNECVYRFIPAVAPGVAAADAGVIIDLSQIEAIIDRLDRQFDVVVIEGAGGLLVPVGQGQTFADLAKRLGAPIVVVARAGLGTINHTLLTLEAASTRSLPIAGFVLSHDQPALDPTFVQRNRREIEEASGIPCLAVIPWLGIPEASGTSGTGRQIREGGQSPVQREGGQSPIQGPEVSDTSGVELWRELRRAIRDDGTGAVAGGVGEAEGSGG